MDDWQLKQKRTDVRECVRLSEFLHGVRAGLKRRHVAFNLEVTREPGDANYVALLWSRVVVMPGEGVTSPAYALGGAVRYGVVRVPYAVAFQGGGMACENVASRIAQDFAESE